MSCRSPLCIYVTINSSIVNAQAETPKVASISNVRLIGCRYIYTNSPESIVVFTSSIAVSIRTGVIIFILILYYCSFILVFPSNYLPINHIYFFEAQGIITSLLCVFDYVISYVSSYFSVFSVGFSIFLSSFTRVSASLFT